MIFILDEGQDEVFSLQHQLKNKVNQLVKAGSKLKILITDQRGNVIIARRSNL
jgi:hypothetical protein